MCVTVSGLCVCSVSVRSYRRPHDAFVVEKLRNARSPRSKTAADGAVACPAEIVVVVARVERAHYEHLRVAVIAKDGHQILHRELALNALKRSCWTAKRGAKVGATAYTLAFRHDDISCQPAKKRSSERSGSSACRGGKDAA